MLRRLPYRWRIVITIIVVGAFSGLYSLRLHDASVEEQQNHDLICRLDILFGLDKPLPPRALARLRPSQREALRQNIAACPELTKKGASP